MSRSTWAAATLGIVCLALLALAGCSVARTDASPAPPIASAPPAPPDQAATPPAPTVAAEPTFTKMTPIANPDAMSAQERHKIYGDRYDHPRRKGLARGGHARHHGTKPSKAKAAPALAAPAAQPPAASSPAVSPQAGATPPAPKPQFGLSQFRLPRWLAGPRPVMVNLPGVGRVTSTRLSAVSLPLLALVLAAVAAIAGLAAGRRRREARNAVRVSEPRRAAPYAPAPPRADPFETSVAPFPRQADERAMGEREYEPA